jgi:hypothetical protein
MKMHEIRNIAKRWGVNVNPRRTKKDMIRDIQIEEGYEPCFATKAVCDQQRCLWYEDCFKDYKKWKGIS